MRLVEVYVALRLVAVTWKGCRLRRARGRLDDEALRAGRSLLGGQNARRFCRNSARLLRRRPREVGEIRPTSFLQVLAWPRSLIRQLSHSLSKEKRS